MTCVILTQASEVLYNINCLALARLVGQRPLSTEAVLWPVPGDSIMFLSNAPRPLLIIHIMPLVLVGRAVKIRLITDRR